ncbi:MAG: hypothetical protein P4L81_07235 [Candidatus Pacebacteria bacterium]|nr:hypothetical protein [Candidatus Paceibacterota bacterium]
MIRIRKLAALDIALHGPTFIISEFALGVIGLFGLGVLSLMRSGTLMGWYLILIGVNYIPLLIYALLIRTKSNASKEVTYEFEDIRVRSRPYAIWQLLILVPLCIVLLSIYQELRKRSDKSVV